MTDTQSIKSEVYNLYNLEANFRTYLLAVINLKSVSVKNYLSDLRYFIGWHQQKAQSDSLSISLHQLSALDIEAYREYLLAQHIPTKTVNRRLSTVRMFGKFLVDQNILSENPARLIANLGSKKPKSSPEVMHTYDIDPEFTAYLASQDMNQDDINATKNDITEFLSIINLSM